jgi:hypothetical protein
MQNNNRKTRLGYRAGVRDGVNKSAAFDKSGMGKRAVSVRITKAEKESTYKPKNLVQKRDTAKVHVYSPGDVDRLRKKKILDDIKAQTAASKVLKQNDKRKLKDKAEQAALVERQGQSAKVHAKNAEESGVSGFAMPVPKILANVEQYENQRKDGDGTVVNITGKRRLSTLLLSQTSKPWYYTALNCCCGLGIITGVVVTILLVVQRKVDEETTNTEQGRALRGLVGIP